MIEIFIAFIVGTLIGYWSKPKTPDLEEQKKIYDKKVIGYEIDITYYKQLCKWHAERNRADSEDSLHK